MGLLTRLRLRRFPATWATFTGLAIAAVSGGLLAVATRGVWHTPGVGLAGACAVVDLQLGLRLVREGRTFSRKQLNGATPPKRGRCPSYPARARPRGVDAPEP